VLFDQSPRFFRVFNPADRNMRIEWPLFFVVDFCGQTGKRGVVAADDLNPQPQNARTATLHKSSGARNCNSKGSNTYSCELNPLRELVKLVFIQRTGEFYGNMQLFRLFPFDRQIAEFALYDGDPMLVNGELDELLAVTAEQIRHAVGVYLNTDNRSLLNVIPAGKGVAA